MTGSLSVLNVGAGDLEVRFNQHEPDEVERAVKMLRDMQQRGYAILVKNEDGSYSRAVSIDAERGLYIISDEPNAISLTSTTDCIDDGPKLPRRRGRRRTAPIVSSHAVGVARSAGG